jgi:hypothetical protein
MTDCAHDLATKLVGQLPRHPRDGPQRRREDLLIPQRRHPEPSTPPRSEEAVVRDEPAWRLILALARELSTHRPDFGRAELIDEVRRLDPARRAESLGPVIQSMTQGGCRWSAEPVRNAADPDRSRPLRLAGPDRPSAPPPRPVIPAPPPPRPLAEPAGPLRTSR